MTRVNTLLRQFILTAILFASAICHGQDSSHADFKYNLWGIGLCQTQNTYLSPLVFSGISLSFTSGRHKAWDKQLRSSFFEYRVNSYTHPNETSSINQFSFTYTYNRYFQVPAFVVFDDYYIKPGIGYNVDLSFSNNANNINNSTYYNLNNILQAGFVICKEHNGYYFYNEFSLPIVGLYSTSEYASPLPYIAYEDDASISSAFSVGSLETNSIFRNSLSVDIEAHTKRRILSLRLNYCITYGKLKTNNIVNHQAFHQFSIGYLFNRKSYVY